MPVVSGSSPTIEAALAAAAAKGTPVVREPAGNELFLDIDSAEDAEFFASQLLILEENIGIEGFVSTVSKSGLPHRHVVVTLARDVTTLERIALQAMLGSDRKHELLSFLDMQKGMEKPTLFFEVPSP